MLELSSWLDIDALERLLSSRHIVRVRHPSQPLSILDYTSRTQFEAHWTPETIVCRGLVVHDDGHVVARPLEKFFNLDEHETSRRELLPAGSLEVTDKLDGSLVILRNDPDGPAASTRGSFVSDQALWATEWLRSRLRTALPEGLTLCGEFVSGRRNRVVLDYGDREEVVVVAARRIADGTELSRPELEALCAELSLPIVAYRQVDSLQSLLDEAMDATNIEGWVVRFPDGRRVKIKVPEYRRIHKLMCMLTPAVVRDAVANDSVDTLMMGLPEELWDEIRAMAAEITARLDRRLAEVQDKHASVLASGGSASRRRYAELALQDRDSKFLFMLLDGRDPRKELLRTLDLDGLERIFTSINRRRVAFEG